MQLHQTNTFYFFHHQNLKIMWTSSCLLSISDMFLANCPSRAGPSKSSPSSSISSSSSLFSSVASGSSVACGNCTYHCLLSHLLPAMAGVSFNLKSSDDSGDEEDFANQLKANEGAPSEAEEPPVGEEAHGPTPNKGKRLREKTGDDPGTGKKELRTTGGSKTFAGRTLPKKEPGITMFWAFQEHWFAIKDSMTSTMNQGNYWIIMKNNMDTLPTTMSLEEKIAEAKNMFKVRFCSDS